MGHDQSAVAIPGAPHLTPGGFVPAAGPTVREFFAAELDSYAYYGFGKAALRDGLRQLGCSGEGNVLVPAYLPDGVVEPFYDLGLEPRFYAVEPDLGPDLADLESRVDADSVAVMVVHYFGFPQPRLDEVLALAADHGLFVVDDNAHSPFSRRGSRLLGTFGDVGFTSFRKTLPLPDGAVLIGVDAPDDASLAGHAAWLSSAHLRHLAGKGAAFARYRSTASRRLVDAALTSVGAPPLGPEAIYAASKVPMSKLSWYLTRTVSPEAVVAARREVYRAWLGAFDGRSGVSVLYDSLPDGVCPQVVPIVFERRERAAAFVRAMDAAGVGGVTTWPVLRDEVEAGSEYETARALAERLVTVPCHQQLSPEAVVAAADVVTAALEPTTVRRRPGADAD